MENLGTTCKQTAELLPWYLNDTLGAEEKAQVEAHLESCAACRQEHRETAFAAAAYASHPPAEDLVSFAFHQLTLSRRRAVVERHLKICPDCREELRLIEESRDSLASLEAEGADEPPRTSSQVVPIFRPKKAQASWGRSALLAASLAAVLGAGIWLWSQQPQGGAAGPGSSGSTMAGMGGERATAGDSAEAAMTAVTPGNLVSRAGSNGGALLELPSGIQQVTLTVRLPESAAGASLELQVLNARGRRIWSGGTLSPLGDGLYEVVLPAEGLPQGEGALHVRKRSGGGFSTVARIPLEVTGP